MGQGRQCIQHAGDLCGERVALSRHCGGSVESFEHDPVLVTTEGWSIVGSYHHVWSDHWESNVLASYLALDLNAQRFHPTIPHGATPEI